MITTDEAHTEVLQNEIFTQKYENPTHISTNGRHVVISYGLSNCVRIFNMCGNHLHSVGTLGEAGCSDKLLRYPSSVFIDDTDTIFIVDSSNYRIVVTDKCGDLQSELKRDLFFAIIRIRGIVYVGGNGSYVHVFRVQKN